MAAVTRNKARPVTPVGYEYVAKSAIVTEDVVAGDLLILGANGWSKSTDASPANKRGFAAQDYKAGRGDCSILTGGEMDGFSGMTPGVPLYPSASVGGGLDTTAVTSFTGLIHAVTATRIAFTL